MGAERTLAAAIGATPLVRLRRVDAQVPGDEPELRRAVLWGKCEQLQPGGSVKDRVAQAMLAEAEREGRLGPGGTIVEPTSGNTGIALAMLAAARGYRCMLAMPANMSLERRLLLAEFGAEVVLTDAESQLVGAVQKAEELASSIEGAVVLGQFDNPANPAIHFATTAKEVQEALAARGIEAPDAFVSAVGTGGTISGVGRYLRPRGTRIVAVEPQRSPVLSGGRAGATHIQGIAAGFVPATFDRSVVDQILAVEDEEAEVRCLQLAQREGLLVGISSGAAVHGALRIACELGPGKHVVVVLCDGGERYFSMSPHGSKETPEAPWG